MGHAVSAGGSRSGAGAWSPGPSLNRHVNRNFTSLAPQPHHRHDRISTLPDVEGLSLGGLTAVARARARLQTAHVFAGDQDIFGGRDAHFPHGEFLSVKRLG